MEIKRVTTLSLQIGLAVHTHFSSQTLYCDADTCPAIIKGCVKALSRMYQEVLTVNKPLKSPSLQDLVSILILLIWGHHRALSNIVAMTTENSNEFTRMLFFKTHIFYTFPLSNEILYFSSFIPNSQSFLKSWRLGRVSYMGHKVQDVNFMIHMCIHQFEVVTIWYQVFADREEPLTWACRQSTNIVSMPWQPSCPLLHNYTVATCAGQDHWQVL